jgi:hypothetical protein
MVLEVILIGTDHRLLDDQATLDSGEPIVPAKELGAILDGNRLGAGEARSRRGR